MKFHDIDKMTNEEMQHKLMSAELKKRKVLGCLIIPILIFLVLLIILVAITFFNFIASLDEISDSLDQTAEYGFSSPEVVTDYYKFE